MSRRKEKGKKRCGFFRRNIFFWIGLAITYLCIAIPINQLFSHPEPTEEDYEAAPEPGYSGGEDGFYVVDKAGVLSDETKSFIEAQGEALCASTKAQVAVVVDQDSGDDGIYPYSMNLFDENKYGDVKLDNGVLLVMLTNEEQDDVKGPHARITTGYGVEGCLPDGKCGRILDTYTMPAMKEGNYDKAAVDTWKVIATTVYQEYGVEVPAAVNMDTTRNWYIQGSQT